MSDLAKRVVACPGWRWLPGMLATHRWIDAIRLTVDDDGGAGTDYVVRAGPDGNEVHCIHECGIMGSFPGGDGSAYPMLPDLTDPATLGCLLALVREAWGAPDLSTVYDAFSSAWFVVRADEGVRFTQWRGATEVEALVVALETAPNNNTKGE